MTLFALTRPWWGVSRRELAIGVIDGEQVVRVTCPGIHRPFLTPTAAVVSCVVLGAPSGRWSRGHTRSTRVFDGRLSDGGHLARRPTVLDLTTTRVPTLALLLAPPQPVPRLGYGRHRLDSFSWLDARRRDARTDVVLCSPVEPDAVARELESVGVIVDDDPDRAAVRLVGLAGDAHHVDDARSNARRGRWLGPVSVLTAAAFGASLVPALGVLRPVAFGLLVATTIGRQLTERRR